MVDTGYTGANQKEYIGTRSSEYVEKTQYLAMSEHFVSSCNPTPVQEWCSQHSDPIALTLQIWNFPQIINHTRQRSVVFLNLKYMIPQVKGPQDLE